MCVLPVPLLPSSRMFFARQILAAGQFQHQRFVQRRDSEEVEAVEALYHGELGLPDAALGGAAVAIQQLQFGQSQ